MEEGVEEGAAGAEVEDDVDSVFEPEDSDFEVSLFVSDFDSLLVELPFA